jgi:formate dehydrogenase subunit gamma
MESTAKMINLKTEKQMILRFQFTEICLHWAIAIPFLVCYLSAVVLIFVYNPEPTMAFRTEFSWLHKGSALALITLPPLMIMLTLDSWKIHLENIKEGWLWKKDDVIWLLMMLGNSVGMKFKLPESEKFNAAEKINFMMVMTFYPLFILTGAFIWLFQASFAAWVAHFAMAIVATPLVWGHIYMATINKDTKAGLSGMITGYVSADWAAHHYHKWFHRNFENLKLPNDYVKPVCVHHVADLKLAASLILLGQKYRGHGQVGDPAFYFEETEELEYVIERLAAGKIHVNHFYHEDIVKKLSSDENSSGAA